MPPESHIPSTSLAQILTELDGFRTHFIESTQRMIEAGGRKLRALDFVAAPVSNRALSLASAYVTLTSTGNYLAAVSLIRLQLDNALRFFAATLVADSDDFALHFLSGKAIRDYADIHGKKLTDNYLAQQLEKCFPGTLSLYRETCGYIHLSEQHVSPTITHTTDAWVGMNTPATVGLQVGNMDTFSMEEKIDFSRTMLEVSKLVLIVLEGWKHEKDKLSLLADG